MIFIVFLVKFSLSPPPTIILWTNIPFYASCDSKEISRRNDSSLNSYLVNLFIFQSHASAFPTLFCALAVGQLQQATLSSGSRLVWPGEGLVKIRGREEPGGLCLHHPSPLFVVSIGCISGRTYVFCKLSLSTSLLCFQIPGTPLPFQGYGY